MRFTPLSWFTGCNPDDRVTAVRPGFRTSLLTMTPSTTQSGSLEPLMDVMPRICTWPPPPGAPEFIWMFAPGTLP